MNESKHIPVLTREVVDALTSGVGEDQSLLLDCTLGGGGHSEALLESEAKLFLIGVDRDPSALNRVSNRLSRFSERTHFVCDSYENISRFCLDFPDEVAELFAKQNSQFARILIDLGISSDQLDDPERGFSFSATGPLDMRMNQTESLSASDVVNSYSEADLTTVFKKGGVGKNSKSLAREIVNNRPFNDTSELAELIKRQSAKRLREPKKSQHPATVPFQAIRIEVNDEFNKLEKFLSEVPNFLAPGGVLAAISFHSSEDQRVAGAMRSWSRPDPVEARLAKPGQPKCFGKLLARQAIVPTEEEIAKNPRARSAMMRIFQRGVGE